MSDDRRARRRVATAVRHPRRRTRARAASSSFRSTSTATSSSGTSSRTSRRRPSCSRRTRSRHRRAPGFLLAANVNAAASLLHTPDGAKLFAQTTTGFGTPQDTASRVVRTTNATAVEVVGPSVGDAGLPGTIARVYLDGGRNRSDVARQPRRSGARDRERLDGARHARVPRDQRRGQRRSGRAARLRSRRVEAARRLGWILRRAHVRGARARCRSRARPRVRRARAAGLGRRSRSSTARRRRTRSSFGSSISRATSAFRRARTTGPSQSPRRRRASRSRGHPTKTRSQTATPSADMPSSRAGRDRKRATHDAMAPSGEAVAHHEERRRASRACSFAAAHRTSSARVRSIRRSGPARGEIVEILEPSPSRVATAVRVRRRVRRLRLDALVERRARAAAHACSIEPIARGAPITFHAAARTLGYRTRARFHAKGGRVGYFGARSHALVRVDTCVVSIRASTRRAPRSSRSSRVRAVTAKSASRWARAAPSRTCAGRASFRLRSTRDSKSASPTAIPGLSRACAARHDRPAIFGDPSPSLAGADGTPLELAPGGFSQAHDDVNVALARRVAELARRREGRSSSTRARGTSPCSLAPRRSTCARSSRARPRARPRGRTSPRAALGTRDVRRRRRRSNPPRHRHHRARSSAHRRARSVRAHREDASDQTRRLRLVRSRHARPRCRHPRGRFAPLVRRRLRHVPAHEPRRDRWSSSSARAETTEDARRRAPPRRGRALLAAPHLRRVRALRRRALRRRAGRPSSIGCRWSANRRLYSARNSSSPEADSHPPASLSPADAAHAREARALRIELPKARACSSRRAAVPTRWRSSTCSRSSVTSSALHRRARRGSRPSRRSIDRARRRRSSREAARRRLRSHARSRRARRQRPSAARDARHEALAAARERTRARSRRDGSPRRGPRGDGAHANPPRRGRERARRLCPRATASSCARSSAPTRRDVDLHLERHAVPFMRDPRTRTRAFCAHASAARSFRSSRRSIPTSSRHLCAIADDLGRASRRRRGVVPHPTIGSNRAGYARTSQKQPRQRSSSRRRVVARKSQHRSEKKR